MSQTERWHRYWLAIVLTLAGLDLWRENQDIKAGRTHSTGTTFSATNRWAVEHIPGGRWVFLIGLGWAALWYAKHIDGHLDQRRAAFRG